MKRYGIAALFFAFLLIGGFAAWSWRNDSANLDTTRPVAQSKQTPKQARQKPTLTPKPTARRATTAERQNATRSILGQLDAFRRDDYKTAIRYQSKSLHQNFPSVAAFRRMIRQSYPQFARYKSASFGTAMVYGKGKDAVLGIPIALIGQDGIKIEATYIMTKENGVYRVSGVNGGARFGNPKQGQPPQLSPEIQKFAPLIT